MSLTLTLFFSTFVLEDVALASALALISQGQMSFFEAFVTCSLGIGVGDVGFYFLGRFAEKLPYFKKKSESLQIKSFLDELRQNKKMDFAIVISRAIPGTRVPTYFAAGIIKYSLAKFVLLTALSVSVWVFAALYLGQAFFAIFEGRWLLAFILFFVLLYWIKKMFSFAKDKWALKAMQYSWRKWRHFEFWPAWFFYLPIIPYYIFLSIRHRSFLLPFYASPHFKHGGLIGESKWDFLKHLESDSPETLPAFAIDKTETKDELLKQLKLSNIRFPFIVKPDVGQRGFGVRIVKNESDLFSYLELSEGSVIIQQKSQYSAEAGIFYIRIPSEDRGFIFSITDKKFPSVLGDGKSSLGALILADKRAQIIASTYFERHRKHLDEVLAKDERFILAECGNHGQGALFVNGAYLGTQELLVSIEKITKRVPDFYFGRIDIRYKDEESLKKGTAFEIIEINGAGSEATHIWDANTRLREAYSVLFQQWKYLFLIGAVVKRKGDCPRPKVVLFILDCLRVFLRKGPLTTSS